MLTLGAEPGTTLVLEARGADAEEALEALVRFIENDFEYDESMSQG
jgi:phosphotransferase system HPr-like phosphotransfer protein